MNRDRRQDERYAFESEVEVAAEGEKPFKTATVNLSLGGLCFKSPMLFRSPDVVQLRVVLDSATMVVSAAVRHAAHSVKELNAGPPGTQFVIGVQFVDVSADDRKSLKKQLVQLAKEHKNV